jgi:chromosome partitioning protein
MARILSIVNQKGGVGKTTTAVNLATALAAIYKRTLLVDLDPQGNASTGLGVSPAERKTTIYEVLINHVPMQQAVHETLVPGLKLIPSNIDLSAAEIELISLTNREYLLRERINSVRDDYDYIVIDCPPSLGMLTVNALTASDSLVIPLQCEFYALEGLSHLLRTVEMIRQRLNPALTIDGIVLTMMDKRNRLCDQVEKDVRSCLGTTVYNTVIPRNTRISEAPSFGKPAIIYDIKCAGSMAYLHLAKEMLAREQVFETA